MPSLYGELLYLALATTPLGRYFYFYFKEMEVVAEGGCMTCFRTHSGGRAQTQRQMHRVSEPQPRASLRCTPLTSPSQTLHYLPGKEGKALVENVFENVSDLKPERSNLQFRFKYPCEFYILCSSNYVCFILM